MDSDLRRELLVRYEADQQVLGTVYGTAGRYRQAFEASQPPTVTPWPFAVLEWEPESEAPPPVVDALRCVRSNTRWLRDAVRRVGWPGRDLVGEDGADAAWLLLQHAGAGVRSLDSPENRAFRRACVPLLERAVARGLAHPRHLAHTVDGIASVENGTAVFAVLSTAFVSDAGSTHLAAGLDADLIDAARRRIGLVPVRDDLALRDAGQEPCAVGGGQPEPWPDGPALYSRTTNS